MSATLPQDEIDFLLSLHHTARQARLRMLNDAGWSYSTLGNVLGVPKTTVHFWVRTSIYDPRLSLRPVPRPILPLKSILPATKGMQTRSISPKVPPDLRPKLRELSEKSRRYRAKTPENSPIATANRQLTELAVRLRSQGVPTADIADAAGVSYRAMARRIAKGA